MVLKTRTRNEFSRALELAAREGGWNRAKTQHITEQFLGRLAQMRLTLISEFRDFLTTRLEEERQNGEIVCENEDDEPDIFDDDDEDDDDDSDDSFYDDSDDSFFDDDDSDDWSDDEDLDSDDFQDA